MSCQHLDQIGTSSDENADIITCARCKKVLYYWNKRVDPLVLMRCGRSRLMFRRLEDTTVEERQARRTAMEPQRIDVSALRYGVVHRLRAYTTPQQQEASMRGFQSTAASSCNSFQQQRHRAAEPVDEPSTSHPFEASRSTAASSSRNTTQEPHSAFEAAGGVAGCPSWRVGDVERRLTETKNSGVDQEAVK